MTTTPSPEATEPLIEREEQFSIQERDDDMLIAQRHWQFGWLCIARRPKLMTNDEWRPTAQLIIAALSSSISNAPHSSSHLDHNASVEVSSALADRVETSAITPTDSGEVVQGDRWQSDRERLEAVATADDMALAVNLRERLVELGHHDIAGRQALLLDLVVNVFAAHRLAFSRPEPVGDEALVERVALALGNERRRYHGLAGWTSFEGLEEHLYRDEMRLARAAIQAIPAPATDAEPDQWFASMPKELADSIDTADLVCRALPNIPAPATDAGQSADSLVEAAKELRDDLLMRGEKYDDGTIVVNASFGRWRAFCKAIDRASLPKSPSAGEEA